jgi:hypothetical protein
MGYVAVVNSTKETGLGDGHKAFQPDKIYFE